MENKFWNKVTIVSFFMAFMIVLHHTINNIMPKYEMDVFTLNIFKWLHSFTASWAVSLFFMLSGFLFYRDYNLSKAIYKYKKRFFSLLVPFIVWNTFGLIFWYIMGIIPMLSQHIHEMPFYDGTLKNLILGVFYYKYNVVFWFIFELLVMIALSPIIWLLIRQKYLGLASIVALAILGFYHGSLFKGMRCPDMWYMFLLGGWCGIHCSNKFMLTTSKARAIIFLILSIVASLILFFYTKSLGGGWICLNLFGCILLWKAMDLLIPYAKEWMKGISMFIYAFHYNVCMLVSRMLIIPSHTGGISLIILLIFNTIITFFLCIFVAFLMNKYIHRFYKFLIGGR